MRIERLDGIRALAILLVFGRHAFLLPYGWAGVDLFFVLSGYLITGILRRDRGSTVFWKTFYVKRAARILPPMLLAFLAAYLLFPIPWRLVWPYYAFFAANFANVYHADRLFSLGVLWSLAVEEHFYLLWPFAVRHLNRRTLIYLLTAIIVLEPVARATVTPLLQSFWPLYYLTPFHLDGIAAGSLLGLLLEEDRARAYFKRWAGRWIIALAIIFGLVAAFVPSFHRDLNRLLFNSLGYTLISAIALFFVAYVIVRGDSMIGKLLGHRFLTFLGLISYGMYLVHIIIILVVKAQFPAMLQHGYSIFTYVLLVFPLSVTVSYLSFRFYETPVINWGRRIVRHVEQRLRLKQA